MKQLTYDEICALDGEELNEAVARADGWEGKWYCPHCNIAVDGIKVTFDERHDERDGGCGEYVLPYPDYRSGDLIDRLAREAKIQPRRRGKRFSAYLPKPYGIKYLDVSLTTAILRAWLRWKQTQTESEEK